MEYTVNTLDKTIEIKDATIEEVVQLAKKYKKYRVISTMNITYPFLPNYPVYPYWQYQYPTTPLEPYYVTTRDVSVSTDGAFSATNDNLTINN